MLSMESVQRSPMIQDSFASTRTPDFKARAEAKKAWLARRSAPRAGLLLGLIAGGAIGCLSAVAVMSVVPNEARAPAPGGAAANRAVLTQPARPANDAAGVKAVTDGSTPGRQISTDRIATPPVPATAPPAASTPATATPAAVTRAVTPPPGLARTDVSANIKPAVTPVAAPAAIPAAPESVAAETPPPVVAQTDEQKPKVAEKKKKKKQIAKQRNRTQPTQWARPDNFFFGGDRMARSF